MTTEKKPVHQCSDQQCRKYFDKVYTKVNTKVDSVTFRWLFGLLVLVVLGAYGAYGYAALEAREARADNVRLEERMDKLVTKEDMEGLKQFLEKLVKP